MVPDPSLRKASVNSKSQIREQRTFIYLSSKFHLENLIQQCINSSLHLAQKFAQIVVRGHYLFREPNRFRRSLRKTALREIDNVQGKISERILKSNGGYCVYYPSNVFSQHAGSGICQYGHMLITSSANWLPNPRVFQYSDFSSVKL